MKILNSDVLKKKSNLELNFKVTVWLRSQDLQVTVTVLRDLRTNFILLLRGNYHVALSVFSNNANNDRSGPS